MTEFVLKPDDQADHAAVVRSWLAGWPEARAAFAALLDQHEPTEMAEIRGYLGAGLDEADRTIRRLELLLERVMADLERTRH